MWIGRCKLMGQPCPAIEQSLAALLTAWADLCEDYLAVLIAHLIHMQTYWLTRSMGCWQENITAGFVGSRFRQVVSPGPGY